MIPTWKVAEAKMSVGVNGAFIPFKSAPDSMRRFVRPALFSTGDDEWELQLSGTAVLCRYRGLAVALATNHQAGDGSGKPLPEKFVVLANGGGRTLAIPPKSLHRPQISEEEYRSLQDLCVFDFEDRVQTHRVEALNLDTVLWSDNPDVAVDYSFLIGYPTDSQIINLNNDGQLVSIVNRWIRQDLRPDDLKLLDVDNRNMFVKDERSTRSSIEPDGLSGSPVFSIVRDTDSNRHLRFDGILTDARNDRFAVYPSVHIRDLMDQIIDDEALF
ncbi:hypothetical protein ACLBWX_01130 [Methylobacterium sp. M6A4_1b]